VKKLLKRAIKFLSVLFSIALLFIGLNFAGAYLPSNTAEPSNIASEQDVESIYIVFGPIHSDIAIPFTEGVKKRFAFLKENGVLFDNPNVKYLLFGWGSRAFYTSAKEFKDMRLWPIFKAITGDESVMHISPAGELANSTASLGIKLKKDEYENLLDKLEDDFDLSKPDANVIKGASYGYGDEFFEHSERFHIAKTCNIWTANTLNSIGIRTGWWSAMSDSLKYGLKKHLHSRIVKN